MGPLNRLAAMLTTGLLLSLPVSAAATTPLAGSVGPAEQAGTGSAQDTEREGGHDGVQGAQLLLLMDSSYSMTEDDASGTPKIDAARSALGEVVDALDSDQQVGLRVFGGDVTRDQPTGAKCTDSRLVVPIGAGHTAELEAAIEAYQPTGETPIGYALQQAADDLGPEGNRTILLVSDGIATCDPDPCEVAEQLTADGLDLVVHTVGLGVDDATRSQLQCIAGSTGGQYADAADTDTLTTALTRISTRAFRPFTIEGTPVVGTQAIADAPVIGAGQYTDTLAQDEEHAKHYLLRREVPGSIIHAGATMRPARGGLSAYNVRITTRGGRTCGMSVATPWSGGGSNSFGSTGVSSARYGGYDPDGECATDPELVLSVYPQGGSDLIVGEPYEMVVAEELPATNREELPPSADTPDWEGLTPGEPVEIVAGSSLNDAPVIEPGQTYSSELTRGEIVFFRVPLEHGQRLEALLEVAEPTGLLAETTGPVSDIADIDIIGPNRARARSVLTDTGDVRARAIIQADRAVQAAASTYEVRWANHEGGNQEGAVLAGDYYVAVSLTSNDELLLPVPFTLTTAVVGEPAGVPEYATQGLPGAPTDSATDDTQDPPPATDGSVADAREDEPADDQDDDPTSMDDTATAADRQNRDSGLPWAWLLGGAGVLVAGAGATLLATRPRV